MPSKRGDTAERILAAAREVVKDGGPDRLTFDAIAEKVGISKQAVLYWFPNKARLIEALVRPALEAESAAGRNAIRASDDAGNAIRSYVSALAVFHTSDLDRFRLMYVTPQIGQRPGRNGQMLTTLGRIHPATTAMYDVLAERLVEAGRYGRLVEARRASAAIHTALLGIVLRMAMADALNAPLRLKDDALVDALVDVMAPRQAA